MDKCVDLEDRGLMTEAGRQAFEKIFEYEIIPPDSEINQRIKEEANSDDQECINKVDLSCNSEFTLKNKGAVLTTLLPLRDYP